MGDGGVACVPSQHIMERFSICGGNTNGSNTNTPTSNNLSSSSSSPKNLAKVNSKNMKKLKREKEKRGELGLKRSVNIEKEAVVSNSYGNSNNSNNSSDVHKDEVEEGELGTLPIENEDFNVERSRKYEIRSEIEKGEIVVDKWRKDGEVERGEILSSKWRKTDTADKNGWSSGSWRTSGKEELEKGEFIPDRWRRSEVVKDDYSYQRGRRYDSFKERGWKNERTPPPSSSGKFSGEKELNRSGSHLPRRASRYESGILERTQRISSKIVDEDGYELSNGKNHAREYSSGNRLKRQGADSDSSDRKFRGDSDDFANSKSRKVSDDGTRSVYSSENHSRSYRNNSSRNVSSDRYSSRHYDSSRVVVYDKYNNSPHQSERSPHDRAHYHDRRDWSPARHDRSPYDRSTRYDHSRSPYDRSHHIDRSKSPYERSRHFDNRKRSPSYSEWSPQDQSRYQDRGGRTPSFLERSPDHGRSREPNKKSGVTDKRQSYDGNRVPEEKPRQKDSEVKELPIAAKETEGSISNGNGDVFKGLPSQIEKPSQTPDVNGTEELQENGAVQEMMSMEEDMDICNTPPHDPVMTDAITGKWFYLDQFGEEQGPSRLCELKKLVEEGFLVSDHLIKHFDSDRWVTVEKAVSPLVTANFLPIVSDTVTQLVSPPEAPGNLLSDNGDVSESCNRTGDGIITPSLLPVISSEESLSVQGPVDDLCIDERVRVLLESITATPGKELENVRGK